MPDTERPSNVDLALDENYYLCGPPDITTSAATNRIINLQKKYLISPEDTSNVAASSDEILSVNPSSYTGLSSIVGEAVNRYLNSSSLSQSEKERLIHLIHAEVEIPEYEEEVILEDLENEQISRSNGYLPLSQVLACVFLALDDTDTTFWKPPPGSDADIERMLRLLAFDAINREIITTIPQLPPGSIRLRWAQALDGHEGNVLPINEQIIILQTLRRLTLQTLRDSFNCLLPDGKDPVGLQRCAFNTPFQTIFLPWLLNNQMPDAVLEAILKHDIKLEIIKELACFDVIPKDDLIAQIEGYACAEGLRAMPCDFIPFLATLQSWLQTHAACYWRTPTPIDSTLDSECLWNPPTLEEKKEPNDKLVLTIIYWLQNEFKAGAHPLTESSIPRPDGMTLFYLLDSLFQAIPTLKKLQSYHAMSMLPTGPVKTDFIEACHFLEALLVDPERHCDDLLSGKDTSRLIEHLQQFEKGYQCWRQRSHYDFFTTFFLNWNAKETEWHIQLRSEAYLRLSEQYFGENPDNNPVVEAQILPTIYVNDKQVVDWLFNTPPDNYKINRILLHALNYSPLSWSETFYHGVSNLIKFFKSQPHPCQAQLFQLQALVHVYQGGSLSRTLPDCQSVDKCIVTPVLMHPVLSAMTNLYLSVAPDLSDQFLRRILDPRLGFNPFQRDREGNSFLIVAAKYGQLKLVVHLLRMGVNPDLVNDSQLTALHVAATNNHVHVVETLIERTNNLNPLDSNGNTPLMLAVKSGYVGMSDVLLRAMARPDLPDQEGNTVLHIAMRSNNNYLKNQIVYHPNIINLPCLFFIQNKQGQTGLHYAACQGMLEIISWLIKQTQVKDWLNMADNQGLTPCHFSAEYDEAPVLTTLLSASANPNAEDCKGNTPIFVAKARCIPLLKQHGADLKHKNKDGNNCLLAAIRNGRYGDDLLRAYLDAGVNPEETDSNGVSAAMLAICFDFCPLLSLLLERGIDTLTPFPCSQEQLSILFQETVEDWPEGVYLQERIDNFVQTQLNNGISADNMTITLHQLAEIFDNSEAMALISNQEPSCARVRSFNRSRFFSPDMDPTERSSDSEADERIKKQRTG
jgi:ankyrin repeat protein